jgi:hypothetical protein
MAVLRFAARDPGGANVLVALADSRTFASLTIDGWILPRAERLKAAIPERITMFHESPSLELLEEEWRRCPADVLVTGTSHYAPFEQTLWNIARKRRVPSLGVLDQWMNLAPRFSLAKPDYVTALDTRQRSELIALGFSPDRVILLGHPWLSRLSASSKPAIGKTSDAIHVLFVSEPIRSDVERGVNVPFGFDEFDACRVVHAAAAAAARAGHRVVLGVKCHPYEDPSDFETRAGQLGTVKGLRLHLFDRAATGLQTAAWADLVTGISSMLLVEAMVLGRAAISVQPGLSREDTFAPSARGAARTLTDEAHGRKVLTELITTSGARDIERERHASFVRDIAVDSQTVFIQWLTHLGYGASSGGR